MPTLRPLPIRLLSILVALCVTAPVGAQETATPREDGAADDAAPFRHEARLGRPARAVTVQLEDGERATLVVRAGGREAREELPLGGLSGARVEAVEIGRGHRVGVFRARSQAGEVAALIDGGAIVWTGRTDMHGDPGERTADVIELSDRTGDGVPDVVVAQRSEGAQLCGRDTTLLFPRALDPSSGRLRPVVLNQLAGAPPSVAVSAVVESPGPSGPPLLRALSPTGASSTSGLGEDIAATGPARVLHDGDAATFWAEGRGGPGQGEFVTARWNARFPIQAFAITPSPRSEHAAELGRPQTITLVGDSGAPLRVTFPEDGARRPGERYWVVPPEPVRWRCVSLVLGDAYAPPGQSAAAVHTGLAEIEAYTALDFGRGLPDLVAILVEGGDGGDEASRLLSGLGEPAVDAVAAAWDRLDVQGRRRALRIFTTAARRDVSRAVDMIGRGAMDDNRAVRGQAMQALGTLGPRAGEFLARLAVEPPPIGDEAIRSLLRHPAPISVPGLLAALDADGGSERPLVREGLARALARADAEGQAPFEAWVAAGPSIAARASGLFGLARHGPTRPLARPVLTAAVADARTFEDRWRLIGAARELPPEPAVDEWLAEQAASAEEWMIRAAAVSALGRRESEGRREVALAALQDGYPRVRVEGILVLDSLGGELEAIEARARRDSWPMVRAAAVSALWDRESGLETVRRAVGDRSPRVRRAAVEGLTRAGDREAAPLIAARLRDGDEFPTVSVAALRYVRSLCIAGLDEAIVAVVQRGMEPNAWAPDVDVATVAVDVARAFGGPLEARVRTIVERPDAPASVRAVLEQPARGASCTE